MLVCASTSVFACLSKACAPPPVGSGGSSGAGAGGAARRSGAAHGSVVPKDTKPKVKASDKHPEAPGADNTNAVRGHKGVNGTDPERRIPRLGETVDVYRDLSHGKEHRRGFPDDKAFSVRMASSASGDTTFKTGNVSASAVGIHLVNGRPAWADAAKAAAEKSGKRGVHAFVRGEVKGYDSPEVLLKKIESEPGWEQVSYYPGTLDFFRKSDRKRFVGSDEAIMANGRMYAKNAKWHDTPAPVSEIERRMEQSQKFGLTTFARLVTPVWD